MSEKQGADTSAAASSGLSFIVPTEYVDIPSKGRFYEDGHPLHQKSSVEIKFLTAASEDILTNRSFIRKGTVIEKLLKSLLIDPSIDTDSLLVGDRNAILFAARESGYGADYEAKVACEACGASVNYTFDLAKIKQYEAQEAPDWKDLGITTTDKGTFIVSLPKSKVSVEIRLLRGKHERFLQELAEKKKAKNLPETTLTDQMRAFIVSVNGLTDQSTIGSFVENMPALDGKYLRMIYKKVCPDMDFVHEFVCSECGFRGDITMPLLTSFFWVR